MADHLADRPEGDHAASVNRKSILGVPVDAIGSDEVEQLLRTWLTSADASLHHVVTLNPEHVMAARKRRDMLDTIRSAELITPDGIGVIVADRVIGAQPDQQLKRLTGAELVEILAKLSSYLPDRSMFLLGSSSEAAQGAADSMQRAEFSASIAGVHAATGPATQFDSESLDLIGSSEASILLVAFGSIAQSTWIERNRDALEIAGIRVAVGVGGTFDYLAGLAPAPPALVRRVGLEWLWRLARQPWRWRRQLVLPLFAILVLRDALSRRLDRDPISIDDTG